MAAATMSSPKTAPAAEGLVGGDDERGAFVAGADQREEQVGRLGLERDVADLVDDEQRIAPQPDEFCLQPAGGVGLGEPLQPGRSTPHRRPPGHAPKLSTNASGTGAGPISLDSSREQICPHDGCLMGPCFVAYRTAPLVNKWPR
jgi:hypothetical protein